MTISDDTMAMLMLCTNLALSSGSEHKPLTLVQWNEQARRIGESSLRRPASLLGMTAQQIETELSITAAEAQRFAALLERSAAIAMEISRLESMGLFIIGRAEERYPRLLRKRLGSRAPAILFGAGSMKLLDRPALGVVGSRDARDSAKELATELGRRCASAGGVLCSGAARGIDQFAMRGSLNEGGGSVGLLAESMLRVLRTPETRRMIEQENLLLMTHRHPDAPFHVAGAMERNKLIYALSQVTVIVESSDGEGGTWAGAVEAIRHGWCPVLVWDSPEEIAGNRKLIALGAGALKDLPAGDARFFEQLAMMAVDVPIKPNQGTLF